MAREMVIRVGVLAEKRKGVTRWVEHVWTPVGVTPVSPTLKTGDIVFQDESATRYFLGHVDMVCHATDTEAYVHNFNSRNPALFVVLRRRETDGDGLPVFVQAVTASPYEAQDFEDSAEDIIERVVMPDEIEKAIKAFCDRFYVEEEFRKRKRDKVKTEDLKFGKEPIFDPNARSGGKLDG